MLSKPRLVQRCLTCYRQLLKPNQRCLSSYPDVNREQTDSAKPKVKDSLETSSDSGEIEKTIKRLEPSSLKPNYIGLKNEPFLKNIFAGNFDKTMLAYPEIPNKIDTDKLQNMYMMLEEFFNKEVDSAAIDDSAQIPDHILQKLKDVGVFGMLVPQRYGGLGLTASQYSRLSEAIGLDSSISITLATHQAMGTKGILLAGTEEQKRKYLPRLASGDLIASYCLSETQSGSDIGSIESRATLSEDGQTYILNGDKIWVTNGSMADVFLVFAKTEFTDDKGETQDKLTAFIVEKEFGSVTSGESVEKFGVRGSDICSVHFNNTPVPVENVLGSVGEGFKIAMNILNSGRFNMGSTLAGNLKKLLAITAKHATERKQYGHKIAEFNMIKEKLARISVNIYVMESVTYMTSGIMDLYEEADVAFESACVKIFSSEAYMTCINECLQILGGTGCMKGTGERMLRDARMYMIFEGTNEILRLFISLSGLKHAAKDLKEPIMKFRNRFSHPAFFFKSLFKGIPELNRDVKGFQIFEELHPSLETQAKILDERITKFQSFVPRFLAHRGNEIYNDQMNIRRIADICIELYAMTSCLSRASRSYCLGVRNSDHEMLLAKAFCNEAKYRVDHLFHQLESGRISNMDETYRHIGDGVIKRVGYVPEHPLTSTF